MPQCPVQLAAATSPSLHSPSPTSAPRPFWVTAWGENASPADFSPSLAPAAALGVLSLDSLLGTPGPRLAVAGIAHGQLSGTQPGRTPASPSRRIASEQRRSLAEIFSAPHPQPSLAHRNFQTCSLRLSQGGAMTGLLTLYLFQ